MPAEQCDEHNGCHCTHPLCPYPLVELLCIKCNHPEDEHFSCEVGSFCKKCPVEDNIWEHVFHPRKTI